MRNSLHIWIDVNEKDVKRKSTILLRRDLNFGRIHIDELTQDPFKDSDAKVVMICNLLLTSARRLNTVNNYAVNNYAVDDEIDEMTRIKETSFSCQVV